MFWELVIVGAPFFWILSALMGGLFLYAIFHEKVLSATFSVIVYGLIISFFGNFNVFMWVWDNPWTLLKWGGAYVGIGVFWAVFRWYLFNRKIKVAYDYIRADFRQKHALGRTSIPEDLRQKWREFISRASWDKVTDYYEWFPPRTCP